jgi:tetratricopeptide (TPR) repeat protein
MRLLGVPELHVTGTATTRSSRRLALRVVVRFHDRVVEDRIFKRTQRGITLGGEGDVILPPPHLDAPVATVSWRGPEEVLVSSYAELELCVTASQPRQLVYGPIHVELSLVPQYRLPRSAVLGEGDTVMAVLVVAMTLLGMYVEFGLSICYDTALALRSPELAAFCPVPPAQAMYVESSPEYIARLLKEDYDGNTDRAPVTRPDDLPDAEDLSSHHLPAGNTGPLDRPGGAAETAPEPVRRPHADDPVRTRHQPLPPEPVPTDDAGEPEDQPTSVLDPQTLHAADDGGLEPIDPSELPAEEERGWGFQDWLDANDDRDQHDELKAIVDSTRERLRIDPENPYALTQLGYFQYLAEDLEGCANTYERYIELYPDDAAGYNNLGLVYKRSGEYPKEEGYYRLALALDPDDSYALNNLAVNLAHQGRFEEALAIMDELQSLEPDDPYGHLHRAKILAAMGQTEDALTWFGRALSGARDLDTFHHIEFRQDIRIDPAFSELRGEPEFARMLVDAYGTDAAPILDGGAVPEDAADLEGASG